MRYVVFDFDDTLTERSFNNSLAIKMLKRAIVRGNLKSKAFAVLLLPIAYAARVLQQREVEDSESIVHKKSIFNLLEAGVKNVDYRLLLFSPEELKPNENAVYVLEEAKGRGLNAVVATRAPRITAEYWISELGVRTKVYGVELEIENARVKGLNLRDVYTKFIVYFGKHGKRKFFEKFPVVASIGNNGASDHVGGIYIPVQAIKSKEDAEKVLELLVKVYEGYEHF